MDLVTAHSMIQATAEIPLACGLVAVVDTEDLEFVSRWRWKARLCAPSKDGSVRAYAVRGRRQADGKGSRLIFLHAALLNPPAGLQVDHCDGDGLNNRRSNLRLATPSQNSANRRSRIGRSGYRGVRPSANRWHAFIGRQGGGGQPRRYLGSYISAVEAALAYDRAARRLYGQFARLNFPATGEAR